MKTSKRTAPLSQESYTIGLAGFARISAIEGIELTRDQIRMFEAFDRSGIDNSDRRRAIVAKYARKI
jgi:hypothetical protein